MVLFLELKNLAGRYLLTGRIDNGTTRSCLFTVMSTSIHLSPQIRMVQCSLMYRDSVLIMTLDRPPHQIMIWVGLERYGYLEEAQRLAYRFLYMMTTAFVDFNGVVPEKVRLTSEGNHLLMLKFWFSSMPLS